MARCDDWPCCGHESGCCHDYDDFGQIVKSQFLVWWLRQEDYHGYEPHKEQNPLKIPDYAWKEFKALCGRSGRGRIWIPDHIKLEALPVSEHDSRWTPELLQAGGIIIEEQHAKDCFAWGGKITTLTLDPIYL